MGTPAAPRPRPRLRRAVLVAGVVGGALALLGGLVWGGQRSLIYLPSGGEPPPAGRVIDGAEDVLLHTEDGLELGGWYVPNGLLLLPPSAFFLIVMIIWVLRSLNPEQVEENEFKIKANTEPKEAV